MFETVNNLFLSLNPINENIIDAEIVDSSNNTDYFNGNHDTRVSDLVKNIIRSMYDNPSDWECNKNLDYIVNHKIGVFVGKYAISILDSSIKDNRRYDDYTMTDIERTIIQTAKDRLMPKPRLEDPSYEILRRLSGK